MTLIINKATVQVVSGPLYASGIAINKATVQVVSGPIGPGHVIINKATIQVASGPEWQPPSQGGWTPKFMPLMQ